MAASVKSAVRVLEILKLLSEFPRGLTQKEVSRMLHIPPSSLHALVHTLEAAGYLYRDPNTQYYRLGGGIFRLAHALDSNTDLVAIASPVLEKIRSQCEEAIALSLLELDSILFFHVRPATHRVQVVNQVGSRLPAHATGSGKALLAHLPPERIDQIYPHEELPRLTANTITTKTELRRYLEQARQQGYTIDNEESEPGVWAVAGCVRNAWEQPVFALSIVVPIQRVEPMAVEQWKKLVIESVSEISAGLGLVPGRLRAESQITIPNRKEYSQT